MTTLVEQRPLPPSRPLSGLVYGLLALLFGGALGLVIARVGNPLVVMAVVISSAIALATLLRPQLGVLILAIITFGSVSEILISYHGLPSIAQPFTLLLVVAAAFSLFFKRRRPVGWYTVAIWVTLNAALILASLLYAQDLTRAEAGLNRFVRDAVTAVLVSLVIQRARTLRATIWAMLAVAIALGSLTIFQFVTGTFDNPYWGFAQIDNSSDGSRQNGPFGNANFYGQMMLIFVPLAIDRLRSEKSTALRLVALWALGASLAAIVLSYSRGAFISLIVMAIFIGVRQAPKPYVIGLLMLGAVLIAPVIPASYLGRIATIAELPVLSGSTNTLSDVSFRGRASENMVAWNLFIDNPLLGVGYGNYNARYLEYSRALGLDQRYEARSAHSLYLEVLSEQGLLGIAIFGGMLWSMFQMLRRAQRTFSATGLESYAGIARALEVAMVGYLTAAIFLHLSASRPFWFMVGLTMATLHVARNEALRQSSEPRIAAQI